MNSENCAQNPNGTLKDTSEIQWFNDPDDEIPISQPKKSKSKNVKAKLTTAKKAKIESFLDLEAAVGSGSEDDGDDDGSIDNFIEDVTDDEDTNIPMAWLSLTHAVEANYDFFNHLITRYVERNERLDGYSGVDPILTINKHNIPRRDRGPGDWPLFDIPVKDGKEEIIVEMLTTHAGPAHIRSAFASNIVPGHVYVEGCSLEAVQKCATIYSDAYDRHIKPAPTTCWESCTQVGSIYIPTQYSWVRLKGSYRYDLAFITDISSDDFTIDYEDVKKKIVKGYIFQAAHYTPNGFIVQKLLDTDDYYQAEAIPTIEELRAFNKCEQVPAWVMAQSRRTSLSESIKIGDQVKVLLQGGDNHLAFIEDIEGEKASLVLVDSPSHTFSQPLILLQKFISGAHKGSVGMVTNVALGGKIGDEVITIAVFPLHKGEHWEVRSSDIDFCREVQRSKTFQWQGDNTILASHIESYGSEAYKMRMDPYRDHYGKYIRIRAGALKGTLGILKDVSASNIAQIEILAQLMVSGSLVCVPMKNVYIPGYSPKALNDLTEIPEHVSNISPSICLTPRWENDSGIGSLTPAWNPGSRTPSLTSTSNTMQEESMSFIHRIPDNLPSSCPLQASTPLPASMTPAVVGEGTSRWRTAFDDHWVKHLIDLDGAALKQKNLAVIITGMIPTETSVGFENGRFENDRGIFKQLLRDKKCFLVQLIYKEDCIEIPAEFVWTVPPDRAVQCVIIINLDNFQERKNDYCV
ncbi:hypothetical protein BDQ17DRAFT_1434859 [Cyathus striatus]|nr:hypothetical protein BDQ17DRAFT_1434859 [Cyathus striatus]